jgi:hypothetical protein
LFLLSLRVFLVLGVLGGDSRALELLEVDGVVGGVGVGDSFGSGRFIVLKKGFVRIEGGHAFGMIVRVIPIAAILPRVKIATTQTVEVKHIIYILTITNQFAIIAITNQFAIKCESINPGKRRFFNEM